MTDSTEAKRFIAEFIRRVWSDGDIEAADAFVAPQYTVRHDPGDPWDGKVLDLNGYKERVRMLRAPFPDQRFDLQRLFVDGDAVAVTWLWTATHTGDIPGFRATGTTVRMSGATVYTLDRGRVTGHWQITDRLGVYQQLRQAGTGA